jgi:hypothetical protein
MLGKPAMQRKLKNEPKFVANVDQSKTNGGVSAVESMRSA